MPCKISFTLISCYIKTVPAYRHFCPYRRNCFYFYMILLRQSSLTLLPTETCQSSFSAVPLLPAPAVRAAPASVFLMFWYFLKVVYNRACESRGEWIKVRKLKMYKSLTFFLFNVIMTKKKRVLRPYSIITQAGCSLLFLCAKYHKDTFFHLHRAAQAFLLRKYYSESRCHFLRKQADQIVHHNDTNHF